MLRNLLEELWLRSNNIEYINSSLNHLPRLIMLQLGNNRISAVDSTIRLPYLLKLGLQ